MHAVYEYGLFEELCSTNPCSGWRLKGVKSDYKAIIVTPQQTPTILKSMTDLLHFLWCLPWQRQRFVQAKRCHYVAISNHRLVALADDQVSFRWRDSADHNRQKVITVSRDEFLRRFLLHLLPKGFVRIRHFGFLANRRRAALLPRCFAALHATPPKNESETSTAPTAHLLWRCPKCGGPMAAVERFTPAQLQLRSPPLLVTAA